MRQGGKTWKIKGLAAGFMLGVTGLNALAAHEIKFVDPDLHKDDPQYIAMACKFRSQSEGDIMKIGTKPGRNPDGVSVYDSSCIQHRNFMRDIKQAIRDRQKICEQLESGGAATNCDQSQASCLKAAIELVEEKKKCLQDLAALEEVAASKELAYQTASRQAENKFVNACREFSQLGDQCVRR